MFPEVHDERVVQPAVDAQQEQADAPDQCGGTEPPLDDVVSEVPEEVQRGPDVDTRATDGRDERPPRGFAEPARPVFDRREVVSPVVL